MMIKQHLCRFGQSGRLLLIAVMMLGCMCVCWAGETKDEAASKPAAPAKAAQKPPRPPFMSDKLTTEGLQAHKGEPGLVRLNWSTQSEENNFGFNVMRGTSKEGEFLPVNEKPILGAGNSSTENKYEFFDKTVHINDVYYYYLEQIDFSGQVNIYSPKIKQVVKYLYDASKDPDAPKSEAAKEEKKPEAGDAPKEQKTSQALPDDVKTCGKACAQQSACAKASAEKLPCGGDIAQCPFPKPAACPLLKDKANACAKRKTEAAPRKCPYVTGNRIAKAS